MGCVRDETMSCRRHRAKMSVGEVCPGLWGEVWGAKTTWRHGRDDGGGGRPRRGGGVVMTAA